MLLIDRRNRRNVQIFLVLSSFMLISGFFVWFFRFSDWQNNEFLAEDGPEITKNDREVALEKVRKLQKGLNEVAGNTVYDDPSKNTVSENRDNLENANALYRTGNSSLIDSKNGVPMSGMGVKMTADSFYDEKLKQKQEEDRIAEQDQEDVTDDEDVVVSDVIIRAQNQTVSRDLLGKSAAVQTWLAKQEGVQKPLSAFESSLKVEEVEMNSKRRNPKFEVDPEIEKRKNRVHQFKF